MRVTGTTSALKPSSAQPLHPWVRPAEQRATLTQVFETVERAAKAGQRPVVQLDLDLTTLLPVERTRQALRTVARRFGVEALARQSVLPGYTDGAWETFLAETGLERMRPDVDWKALYTAFRSAYWYGDTPGASRASGYVGLETDAAAPGLKRFVEQIRRLGGEVVFNSGRGVEAAAGTKAALERAGIERPTLFIGSDPTIDGGQVKKRRQQQLDALGTTVAILDDRQRNRDALQAEAPGALLIAVAPPGFTAEPQTKGASLRLSTFEAL